MAWLSTSESSSWWHDFDSSQGPQKTALSGPIWHSFDLQPRKMALSDMTLTLAHTSENSSWWNDFSLRQQHQEITIDGMIFFPLHRPQKIVHDRMTLALNRRTLAFTINLRKWLSMAPLLPLSVEQEWLLRAQLLVIISAFRRRPLMPRLLALVGNLQNWFRNFGPCHQSQNMVLDCPSLATVSQLTTLALVSSLRERLSMAQVWPSPGN